MAELVHYNVINECERKLKHPIIEVQIATARTTPPPSSLIANRDATDRALVRLIEIRDARDDEHMRFLLSPWRIAHGLIMP